MKAGDRADRISLLKLAQYVGGGLGPHLAAVAIRRKWLGTCRASAGWPCKSSKAFTRKTM